MKRKKIVTGTLIILVLISFSFVAKFALPLMFFPTPITSPYPPCNFPVSGHFYPSKLISQINLSDDLILKEYQGYPDFQGQESGCSYAGRDRVNTTEISLQNSFKVNINQIGDEREKIIVFHKTHKVYETEISTYVFSGLLEAWGYDNHWVIEVVMSSPDSMPPINDKIDIIRDGISLKTENGYKEVFAFQVLAGKPFYFFREEDNTLGINYDDIEIMLDYDDIPYNNPHPGLDISINQYQNMVSFFADKNGARRKVVISALNK